MHKYGLHGKLKAQAGKGEELAAILLAAAKLVATAPGCHLYLVSKNAEDPDSVWITEVWDTKADHDASLGVPGVRELISQAMPIMAGMPAAGMVLEVLGGFGLPTEA